MSELIQNEEWRAAHRLDPSAYFPEVYRLLCHVLSSPSIANVQQGFRGHLLSATFQQAEISRLMIHVASYYRVKYDGSWEHATWLHDEYEGVGLLVEDLNKPDATVKLPFRKACNKIIHANRVHFDGTADTKDAFCRAAFNVIV